MNFEREFTLFRCAMDCDSILTEIEGIMGNQIFETTKTLSTGLDLVKKLTDIAISTKNMELQETVLELKNKLIEAKGSLIDVKEENLDLKEQNLKMAREIEKIKQGEKSKPQLQGDYYYTAEGDGPLVRDL